MWRSSLGLSSEGTEGFTSTFTAERAERRWRRRPWENFGTTAPLTANGKETVMEEAWEKKHAEIGNRSTYYQLTATTSTYHRQQPRPTVLIAPLTQADFSVRTTISLPFSTIPPSPTPYPPSWCSHRTNSFYSPLQGGLALQTLLAQRGCPSADARACANLAEDAES